MSSLNPLMRSRDLCRIFAADPRALETEIDRLVYALYGLTPADIAIVEGKTGC